MTARAFRGGRCCCIAALSCLLLQLAWATAVPGSTAARTFGSSYNSAILGHQRQQQPAHDVTSGTPANLLVAVSGSESEVPESHHHHPGWARTEPRIVLQQGQQSTRSDAARTVLSQGHSITDGTSKGSSSGSSSARRQLVQLPPLRQPPQITIQELLSAADVSGDGNGSVQVKLPAVKPPENGSQSETQLPPVVVNLRISDLFPDESHGKRLLHGRPSGGNSREATGPTTSTAVKDSGCHHGSSSSKVSNNQLSTSSTACMRSTPAVLSAWHMQHDTALPSRRLRALFGRSHTMARDSISNRHPLEAQGGTGNMDSNTGDSNGLTGYVRDNPDSAQSLQKLSGGRSPQLQTEQQHVTFCDLFNPQVGSGCRRGDPGRHLLQTLAGSTQGRSLAGAGAAVTTDLPMPATISTAATSLVARGRHLLQGLASPAGLSTWLQTANQDEQQMVQQILGSPSSSSSSGTRIVDVVGSSGGNPPRRAARHMLSLGQSSTISSGQRAVAAARGGARVLQGLEGYATWFSGASPSDQQYSQQLVGGGDTRQETTTIRSVVAGDAGNGGQGGQGGGSGQNNRNHKLRRLLAATQQGGQGDQPGTPQRSQSTSNKPAAGSDAGVVKWKSAAQPEERQMFSQLSGNSDKLVKVPSVQLSDVRDAPTSRPRLTGPMTSIAYNPVGTSP